MLTLISQIKNNYIKHNFELTYKHNAHDYSTRQANHLNFRHNLKQIPGLTA